MSSRLLKNNRRRSSPLMPILSALFIVIALGLFIIELINFTQGEDRLPAGVTVAGINVGNLTDNEAIALIQEAYSESITLYYQDNPINLNPDAIGFSVNTPVMIAQARASGESGTGFWGRFINYMLGREEVVLQEIPLQADYQANVLEAQLDEIARIYDRPSGSAIYDVATLTISAGETGYVMNTDAALPLVEDALLRPNERIVELPIIGGEAAFASLDVLEDMILDYLDSQGFIYDGQQSVTSIFILDLTTGEEVNIQSDVAYSAASTNKVPILIDYYRVLNREPNQDDAFLMANSLLCSANSTSNLIMETFLGSGNIFSGLASVTNTAQYIGAENTFLTAPFIDGSANQELGAIQAPETNPNSQFDTDADTFNQTTAEDMGTMFSLLYDCANYDSGLSVAYSEGEITTQECKQMLELMSAVDLERLLQAGIPEDAKITHKNGWIPGGLAGATGATVADAGIVYSPNGRDYVISIYLWEETDGTGIDRWILLEEISRATWNFFNPDNQLAARRSNIPATATECYSTDALGNRTYNYLPPYGEVDLNNINGWRDGTATTPQPLPGS